jgi:hypothetical protein
MKRDVVVSLQMHLRSAREAEHPDGVNRDFQRDLQHIGLPTACSVVYASIAGCALDAGKPAEMQLVLNEVARAMAYVIRVYSADQAGIPRAIGGFDAMQGQFVRGAHAFQTKGGSEIGGLTVQRRDMMRAIDVLRSAGVRFRVPSSG